MSVVQNPITGRTSGKCAGVVFSKWKSKNTMRGKPLTVKNPQSAGQVVQRSAFAFMVLLAQSIIVALRSSFKYAATEMSEYNYFIKQNIDLVDAVTHKIEVAHADELKFAAGPEPGFYDTAAVAAAGGAITITWDDTYQSDLREPTDEVIGFYYNSTTDTVGYFDNGDLYSAGTMSLTGSGTTNDIVYVYLAVATATKSRWSHSNYVDVVTLIA